jgi:hypothetical protein
MGLDNGFEIRDKSRCDLRIAVGYFRNYHELDIWCMSSCESIERDANEVLVTKEDAEKLYNLIKPVATELLKLEESKVGYYDDNGYPQRCQEALMQD